MQNDLEFITTTTASLLKIKEPANAVRNIMPQLSTIYESHLNSKIKKWILENVEGLHMSPLQEAIVEKMSEMREGVTLKEIGMHITKKGFDFKTGYVVGGSLAGLSKKADGWFEMDIYEKKWSDDRDNYLYRLKDSAYDAFNEYFTKGK